MLGQPFLRKENNKARELKDSNSIPKSFLGIKSYLCTYQCKAGMGEAGHGVGDLIVFVGPGVGH